MTEKQRYPSLNSENETERREAQDLIDAYAILFTRIANDASNLSAIDPEKLDPIHSFLAQENLDANSLKAIRGVSNNMHAANRIKMFAAKKYRGFRGKIDQKIEYRKELSEELDTIDENAPLLSVIQSDNVEAVNCLVKKALIWVESL